MTSRNSTITSKDQLDNLLRRSRDSTIYIFTDVCFEFEAIFKHVNKINISNCTFNEKLTLDGSIAGEVLFQNVIFEGGLCLSNCQFRENIKFHHCKFKDNVDFENTRFVKLADFYGSIFYNKTIFFKTDFLDRVVFSAATFKNNALFTYTLISGHFLLRGATFDKGLDLSLSVLSGPVNLFELKISNFESKQDIIDFSDYDEAVREKGIITHKNKRETFRILKKVLLEQGNSIDALQMAAKEKRAYSAQLRSDSKLKIGKWYRRGQNRLILFLGKISNAHGESWTRGVAFTCLIGLFFFSLSIFSTKMYNWDTTQANLDYYFEFLIPTHESNYLDHLKPNGLFKLWDFLGRIFVSFGIYQTVVAFRKYHTK